jgi:cysteine synthase B
MSSGAAIAGAIKLAAKMKKGVIVTVLADRGDRYLSTQLFRFS